MSRTHELKTWPSHFEAVRLRKKTFEARRNDRDFAVGDVLHLCEYDPAGKGIIDAHNYSGRSLLCEVTHVLYGGEFGIEKGHCVMSIRVTDDQS